MDDVQFGASLEARLDDPPGACPARDAVPAGSGLPPLAAATPYLRRLDALAMRIECTGVLGLHVRACVDEMSCAVDPPAAPVNASHPRALWAGLLEAAITARLLRLDEERGRLHLGPEASLIAEHPLAAWGESLIPALLGDGLNGTATRPRWYDDRLATVPALLFQRLVYAGGDVDLMGDADALRDEIEAGRPLGLLAPTRVDVQDRIAVVVAVLVELGLVSWMPEGASRLGTAAVTPLGLFGNVVLACGVDDEPPPAVAELLAAEGYTRVEGGYLPPPTHAPAASRQAPGRVGAGPRSRAARRVPLRGTASPVPRRHRDAGRRG